MKRTVLITGAAKGIGAAIVRRFAERGDRVAIHYKTSEAQAEALCAELSAAGYEVFAVSADLSCAEEIRRMMSLVEHRFGGVDVLVNNAAVAQQKPFRTLTEGDWDAVFDSNVKSVFLCTQGALPHMLERRFGSVVNIASVWGQTGASCEVAYSAAKAALIGMTRALAKELGPSGIRVNCVAPGVIQTDMTGNLSVDDLEALKEQTPLGMIGRPEDVAGTVVFLASEDARFITGQVVSPNGGLWIG